MKQYSLRAVELFSESTLMGDLIPLNIYPILKEQHFDSPAALEKFSSDWMKIQWESSVKNGNNTMNPQ